MIAKSEINKYLDDRDTKILTGTEFLSEPCEEVELKEGEEIAAKLFRVLSINKNGIGLSANQIGINKRVCVFNVKQPVYLINPRYKSEPNSTDLIYMEGCLSFPERMVRTKRFSSIEVIADNIEGSMVFDVSHIPADKWITDLDVLECVAVQHEIDHLDGLEMFDREYRPMPQRSQAKIGRNDYVTIYNTAKPDETKILKFKKYESSQNTTYAGWLILVDKSASFETQKDQMRTYANSLENSTF